MRLTFAGTIEIPGRVEYIHPLHNLAMVSYDPALIGATPAKSAVLQAVGCASGRAGVGDWDARRWQGAIAHLECRIGRPGGFPLSRTLQFRDANLETIALVNGPEDYDGVLTNKNGEVIATWASFAYEAGREMAQENRGIPAELIAEMLTSCATAAAAIARSGAAAGAAGRRTQARVARMRGSRNSRRIVQIASGAERLASGGWLACKYVCCVQAI